MTTKDNPALSTAIRRIAAFRKPLAAGHVVDHRSGLTVRDLDALLEHHASDRAEQR